MRTLAPLLAFLVAACGPASPALHGSPGGAAQEVARSAPRDEEPERPALPEPVLLVTDGAVLTALVEAGLSLERLVTAGERETIRATIARDIAAHQRRDPRSGIGIRHAHRLFDPSWLRDPRFGFELVGVVNRIDRRAFHPGTCGETRIVYRLAYRAEQAASRMPMTVNVVFFQRDPEGDCARVLRRWQRSPAALARDGGPLHPSMLEPSLLKSVEIDLQSVRWPGTVRTDLGGHAEYILRVFEREGDRLRPAPLENQPDTDRLRRDPSLRAELIAWLREPGTLAAIDQGTVRVPERFLATRAVSVAPHGLARAANRPFRSAISADELGPLDLSAMRTVRTPAALLRRLDALSCTGCHQSRSLAGFHLLGEERGDATIDRLATGSSPHLRGDLLRRAAYARAIASGRAPDELRDYAEHEGGVTRIGAHCGLGDPSFSAWVCPEGTRCVEAGEAEVGVCVGNAQLGDACELVAVDRRDHGTQTPLACGGHCNRNRHGFPGGLCTAPCSPDAGPDVVCGAIPALRPFNDCIARREPFARCLASTSRPSALLACDADRPCRDDYVCARTADGRGGCIPPYFLFQLRVDGHPL